MFKTFELRLALKSAEKNQNVSNINEQFQLETEFINYAIKMEL